MCLPPHRFPRTISSLNFKVHNLGAVLWTFESTKITNENGKYFYMVAIVKWLMAQHIIDISCKRKWSNGKSELHTVLTMAPHSIPRSAIEKLIDLSVTLTNGFSCVIKVWLRSSLLGCPICFRFRPRSRFLQHSVIHKRNHLIWTFPWFMAQELAQNRLCSYWDVRGYQFVAWGMVRESTIEGNFWRHQDELGLFCWEEIFVGFSIVLRDYWVRLCCEHGY